MKKKPTLEQYKTLGAKFRLLNYVLMEVLCDKTLSKSESKIINETLKIISNMRSDKEKEMFNDYPELSKDYVSVFFGELHRKLTDDGTGGTIVHNTVDKEVICTAKDIAKSFFDESVLRKKKNEL